jgi:hypothetical protein
LDEIEAPLKRRKNMEYQLEIYRPGSCDEDACIRVFTSAAPFLPIHVGDLLDAATWGKDASEWKLLRVLNVEHLISEKSGGGIDPSGRAIHRALVYTERTADTAETRNRVHATA